VNKIEEKVLSQVSLTVCKVKKKICDQILEQVGSQVRYDAFLQIEEWVWLNGRDSHNQIKTIIQ
jgi:hypothetical protein